MHKQSLFHISKRDALPWYQRVLIRGGAILLALIVCALVTSCNCRFPSPICRTSFEISTIARVMRRL